MTECTPSSFGFEAHFSRDVVARFDGGTMTSDGGALLLRETNRRLNLLPRLAACFEDRRQPWLISETVEEMVSQRVYGLALGYEDLNDHDQLREDPLLGVLSGKRLVSQEPLAGKSTLNRLELGGEQPSRYKKIHCREQAIDELLTQIFLEAHAAPPSVAVPGASRAAVHGPIRREPARVEFPARTRPFAVLSKMPAAVPLRHCDFG
jgi:hypothetical protein